MRCLFMGHDVIMDMRNNWALGHSGEAYRIRHRATDQSQIPADPSQVTIVTIIATEIVGD